MRKKVLLVWPSYKSTFFSLDYALDIISKKAAFPPLGLLTIAPLLPADWELQLIDMNVTPLNDADIQRADLIMISAMGVQRESVQAVCRECGKYRKTVVAGGPLFNDHMEEFPGVNHFVLGEGEMSLPLFLDDYVRGRVKRVYSPGSKPDLSRSPAPMWSLINFNNYASMILQFSRGCPHNCEFCYAIVLNGRKPRTKTPEQMLREIQSLYDLGWRGTVGIVDDNFIGHREKAREFLRRLVLWQQEKKYPFDLLTETTLGLADAPELVRLMVTANFKEVLIGIESPNTASLQEAGKTHNLGMDPGRAVKFLQRQGLRVLGGFMLGFDHDRAETIFDEQIRFISENGIVIAMVSLLGVQPGTRLWKRLDQEERLLDRDAVNNTDGRVNFLPGMGMDNLILGYKRVLTVIYEPLAFYQRIDVFLKDYRPAFRRPVQPGDLLTFLKVCRYLGFASGQAGLFWKYLFKTLFTRYRALPTLIELLVVGVHLQKLSREISTSPDFSQE